MSQLDRTATHAEPSAPHRQLELWVIGPGLHQRLAITGDTVTIGRSETNTISIQHSSVSRHHLTLFVGATVFAEDHGSKNGTKRNGQAMPPVARHPIGLNDVLEIGPFRIFLRPIVEVSAAPSELAPIIESAAMKKVWALAMQVARGDLSLLVLGETGVGKDVLARAIHHASGRAKGPFVRLNCGALNESLLESELFGHAKGAFTGAVAAREGLIETAEKGTLFLDEVGELSPVLQAKLLHVLETRELTRVGSTKPTKVDVRFVAATHRTLMGNPAFRSDLYFRLAGAVLEVPPLRDRPEDVLPLARQFLEQWAASRREAPPSLSERAVAQLRAHRWPGNVRELRSAMERAALTSGAVIDSFSFTSVAESAVASERPSPTEALPEGGFRLTAEELAERERMLEALRNAAGNQTRAAKALGWARSTFAAKLVAYRVPRPRS